MIVGCYALHLYCDTEGCPNANCRYASDGIGQPPGNFTHEKNERGAIAKARRAGWKLNLDTGKAYCPKCDQVSEL